VESWVAAVFYEAPSVEIPEGLHLFINFAG